MSCQSPAGVDNDARVASQMIVAGLRDMTVSENDAQWLALCTSVVQRPRRVQARTAVSCFRNVSSDADGRVLPRPNVLRIGKSPATRRGNRCFMRSWPIMLKLK